MNKFRPGYTIPINLQINYRGVVAHNMLEGQQPYLFQTFVTSLAGLNMLNLISGATVVWRTLWKYF